MTDTKSTDGANKFWKGGLEPRLQQLIDAASPNERPQQSAGRSITDVERKVFCAAMGTPADGLTATQAEALRLAIAYEMENDRSAAVLGRGFAYSTARMLDCVYEKAYDPGGTAAESAKLLVADFAMQRHAQAVVDAAVAYDRHGTEPKEFDRFTTHLIKEGRQSDISQWHLIADGRFHDVDTFWQEKVAGDVHQAKHLTGDVDAWLNLQMNNIAADKPVEKDPGSPKPEFGAIVVSDDRMWFVPLTEDRDRPVVTGVAREIASTDGLNFTGLRSLEAAREFFAATPTFGEFVLQPADEFRAMGPVKIVSMSSMTGLSESQSGVANTVVAEAAFMKRHGARAAAFATQGDYAR